MSDQMLLDIMSHSSTAGLGLGDLQRIGNQLNGVFGQVTGIVRAVIIGFSLLVGTFYAIYFLKKDRSGSEEGKSGLMRVATAIFIAVAISLVLSAFAGWLKGTIR